jgi:hypothetical protein
MPVPAARLSPLRIYGSSHLAAARYEFAAGRIDKADLLRRLRWLCFRAGVLSALLFMTVMLGLLLSNQRRQFSFHDLLTLQGFGALTALTFAGTFYLCFRLELMKLIALRTSRGALTIPEFSSAGHCPLCGSDRRSWVSLQQSARWIHFLLVPAAVNELILGQRFPRDQRTCADCGTRCTDCPTCRSSLDLETWRTAFNWSGLKCPRCESDIPCMFTALSWLVLLPFVRGRPR